MLCLPYYAVFSSTKLEIRAEQVLPGKEGRAGERMGVGKKEKCPRQCMHM
jgi:hypothetical protein